MYSGTARRCCIRHFMCTHQTAALLYAKWRYERHFQRMQIWLCQSMWKNCNNNPGKFHSDPIWNNRALGFSEDSYRNKKNKNKSKMSSDTGSVPDVKTQSTEHRFLLNIYQICIKLAALPWHIFQQPVCTHSATILCRQTELLHSK